MDGCSLCGNTEANRCSLQDKLVDRVTCPTCGEYDITYYDRDLVVGSIDCKQLVSGYLREHQLQQAKGSSARPFLLTKESIESIIDAAPVEVTDRVDRLLINLAALSPIAGSPILIKPRTDYPLGYCVNHDELGFMIQGLRNQRFLETDSNGNHLTIAGWDRVRQLRQAGVSSIQAFVAMWFTAELNEAYDQGIKPAIERAGYKPLRIDRVEHSDRIDDRILLEINRSRFLVADFSGHRQGVYFEAGYALGQKKPVIWACKKKYLGKVHFDTRQYNHIVWDTPDILQELLYNRICVLVG